MKKLIRYTKIKLNQILANLALEQTIDWGLLSTAVSKCVAHPATGLVVGSCLLSAHSKSAGNSVIVGELEPF